MGNRSLIQKQLQEIIDEKEIYPVYQPIVSLKDGNVFGYEALSRISLKTCKFNIEEIFDYAKEFQCLWELDISFISNINNDVVKCSMVEGIVEFCHSKNICIIAEGIETEDEMIQLIRLGIDYGQGYFLGRPDKKLQDIPDNVVR